MVKGGIGGVPLRGQVQGIPTSRSEASTRTWLQQHGNLHRFWLPIHRDWIAHKVILTELSRPWNLTVGSSQGRFILPLGMPRVPPTYRCSPCRGWVGLPTEERSHRTLTTVRNQVATENWVRSGTIPRSVRPIPRQSGLPDSQWV